MDKMRRIVWIGGGVILSLFMFGLFLLVLGYYERIGLVILESAISVIIIFIIGVGIHMIREGIMSPKDDEQEETEEQKRGKATE